MLLLMRRIIASTLARGPIDTCVCEEGIFYVQNLSYKSYHTRVNAIRHAVDCIVARHVPLPSPLSLCVRETFQYSLTCPALVVTSKYEYKWQKKYETKTNKLKMKH